MGDSETPYDKHWEYRDDFIDVGPRFFVRVGLMLRMLASELRRGDSAPSEARLLDVGCGDGTFIQKCLDQGWNVVGMDLSRAAIDRCEARFNQNPHVELYCCGIDFITDEGPFDAVSAGEVLEHIEDDEVFMRVVYSLLKPGGAFVLTVPIDMSLWSDADTAAGHYRRYTVRLLSEKLIRSGFDIERRMTWGWPLARLLHFKIREQQNKRMGEFRIPRDQDKLLKMKPLLRVAKYVFLVDNLFNWTGRGVGVVVKARRPVES
jgi:SAM-dependent methyltransferase